MKNALQLSAPVVKEFPFAAVTRCQMRIKTRQIDAKTGRVVCESPWRKNLLNDAGLNRMARQATAVTPATLFTYCKVGSGTTPNKISSGAITFTQSGTTLTASGGFFTATMAGGLFKWGSGTGGVENYIAAYVSATQVTLTDSATVASPTVGVVWQVQETALASYLYVTNSYLTGAGNCGTTLASGVLTLQRTFNFATQVSTYTVNEIGYDGAGAANGTVNGRLVLPSSDVVPPTNYYQVIMALSVAYSPATPTAVPNVGVNIDTAGTLAIEKLFTSVDTTGASYDHWIDGPSSLSYGGYGYFYGMTATYTQNSEPSLSSTLRFNPGGILMLTNIPAAVKTANRGQMSWTMTISATTAAQTMYGFGMCGDFTYQERVVLDVKLTTPFVLPTGTFTASVVFTMTYDRTLSN